MKDYSTDTEDFYQSLVCLLEGMSVRDMLSIPGVYEIVAQYFYNPVIQKMEEDQEENEED